MTSSALQSRKWQLIGMSQWCRSALCGHPLPALTNNWIHGAASRHTVAPISHTRPSSIIIGPIHFLAGWRKRWPEPGFSFGRFSFAYVMLSRVDTGDKVEFNTVDFVESRQVDRVALAPYTVATKSRGRSTFGRQSRPYWRQKSTVLATKSTATSCRIQVVADLSPKPAIKSTVSAICRQCW